jgi:hypothetical protein
MIESGAYGERMAGYLHLSQPPLYGNSDRVIPNYPSHAFMRPKDSRNRQVPFPLRRLSPFISIYGQRVAVVYGLVGSSFLLRNGHREE